MRYATIVIMLIVCFASINTVFGDNLAEIENLRIGLKDLAKTGYDYGSMSNSIQECETKRATTKLLTIDGEGYWNKKLESLNDLHYQCCKMGFKEKNTGKNTLPEVYRMIDKETENLIRFSEILNKLKEDKQ